MNAFTFNVRELLRLETSRPNETVKNTATTNSVRLIAINLPVPAQSITLGDQEMVTNRKHVQTSDEW